MLAGAHVADRPGLLAVAGQPGGRQRVERHPLGAAGQERLADAGPPEHRPGACGRGGPRRSGSSPGSRSRPAARSNASTPPASISATAPNGLTVERSVTTRSGSPRTRMSSPDRRPPRRCRRGGRSPRCRCGSGGRGSAWRRCVGRAAGPWGGADAGPRVRSRVGRSPGGSGTQDGEDTAAAPPEDTRVGRVRASRPMRAVARIANPSAGGPRVRPDAPRLAAPGRPPQARDPARRDDRAEEVPRGRARAVVAARLRGAGRRRA